MKKLVVIDSGNLQFKSIFAFRNNSAVPVTYTYLSMMFAYLKRIGVTLDDRIIVACDYGNWRKDIDPCLTGDTEVLTENGWKTIKDVVEQEEKIKIATLNNETVEYNIPTKYFKNYYNGKIYHLGGQTSSRIDILTTPEHQNYIANKHNKKFQFIKSKDLSKYPYLFKRDFNYKKTETLKYFSVPSFKSEKIHIDKYNRKHIYIVEYPEKTIPINDWLRLFGWYITEGCISSRKERKIIDKITISQSEKHNPKNCKLIIDMFKRLNISYHPQKRKNNIVSYEILDTQLANYFAQFGKSHYKYIPREFLNTLSNRQCKLLLKYMLKGDGTKRGFNRYVYTTSSIQLANDVQELALKAGFTATLSKKYKNPKTNSEFYFVWIHKIPFVEAKKREIEDWKGFTYDIEIQNHIFYIRRNGKCCWTGNCYKAQRKALRESQEDADFWQEMFREFNEFIPKIEQALPYEFYKIYKREADDIASVAVRYIDADEKVLVSSDADWQMLCTISNTKIFSPYTKKYKIVTNPEAVLAQKINGDKSDNLLEKPQTEEEYNKRKMIVNLLELPEWVEAPIKEAMFKAVPKKLNISKLPFRTMQERLKKLYNL
jgi:hypothetical protein